MISVLYDVVEYLTYWVEESPTNDEAPTKICDLVELTSIMFAGDSSLWSGVHGCRGGRVN